MTYEYCKKIILSGGYDKTQMLDKLDVFLLADRITREQYEELTGVINTPVVETPPAELAEG